MPPTPAANIQRTVAKNGMMSTWMHSSYSWGFTDDAHVCSVRMQRQGLWTHGLSAGIASAGQQQAAFVSADVVLRELTHSQWRELI